MDTKPGVKTSEFWVTLVIALAGILKLFGVSVDVDAVSLGSGLEQLIGGGMALAAAVGYPISRGLAKGRQNSGG